MPPSSKRRLTVPIWRLGMILSFVFALCWLFLGYGKTEFLTDILKILAGAIGGYGFFAIRREAG